MWSERDASARSRKGKIAYSFHPLSYSVSPPSPLLPLSLPLSLFLSLTLSLSVRPSVSCSFSLTLARSTVSKHPCQCDRRRPFGQAHYLPLSKTLETLIQTCPRTHTHIHLIKHTWMWGHGAKNITHALSFLPPILPHLSPHSSQQHPCIHPPLSLSLWLSLMHTHMDTTHM